MTSRDVSRLYPVAPGLYATSQAGYEQWESLNPDERARYVEAACKIRPEAQAQSELPGRNSRAA
jgi:hypothetical protein